MELTIEQALQRAVEAQKLGRLQDAQALYKAILQIQPKNPEANHNLGVMAVSLNKIAAALPLLKIAIEANPNQGQFWISYLDALIKDKQYEDAKKVLEQGKKLGLRGERVDFVEAQLTSYFSEKNSEKLLKNQSLSFNQLQKKIVIHKDKKKISPINFKNRNQIRRPTKIELNILFEHYKNERYDLALNLASNLTEQFPDHPFGWKVIGAVYKQLEKFQDALVAQQKVLDISPDDAEAHVNLGITLHELGRPREAEACYKKAITIKPDFAEAHSNLGITLKNLGRLYDAEVSYKNAIAIKPDYAFAYYNLGNTLKDLGRIQEAQKSYKKAIEFRPNYAAAHYNFGVTLQELGRLEDAAASYKNAIAITPNLSEAYSNLGVILKELGRLEDAFHSAIKSIEIRPTQEAKVLFTDLTQKLSVKTWDLPLSKLVITALIEPWGRPSSLMPFAIRLLKENQDFKHVLNKLIENKNETSFHDGFLTPISVKQVYALTLIQAMLTSAPIPDTQLEEVFTYFRACLLKVGSSFTSKEGEDDNLISFYCSLAQQCFINEYIYFQENDEVELSLQLLKKLTKVLNEDQDVPAFWIITVACYFPLHSIPGSEKLLQKKYSDCINKVLSQQIAEPLEELTLHSSIPSLTSVENQVSLEVQSQYEENPYPRWVRLPKDSTKKSLNAYIYDKFPLTEFKNLNNDSNPEILIAGCGTGQQSIGTAQSIHGAKILAVDLSAASLSYAIRKTAELGIESIQYAQADLLKLNSVGRTFDMIESSGVLHHLEKPFDGWEVLLSLLGPRGLMRVGLYSEIARRDIVRVRSLISSTGIEPSFQAIRNYRKHLLGFKKLEDYGFATRSSDFFSMSDCRDLLFHVQEHRMNLLTIDKFIKYQNLNFLGFDIDSSVIQSYKKRFLNDESATNLDQWHIYEEENPDTFISMYQFYVQKKS